MDHFEEKRFIALRIHHTVMKRHSFWSALAFLAALLVSAGCLAPGPVEKDGGTPAGTPGMTVATPVASQLQENVTPATEGAGDVGEASRALAPGGTYRAGDQLVLSGVTILSPGNHLLVEVEPIMFGPTRKGESLPVAGVSGVVPVLRQEGASFSTWSFGFDTAGWEPGEYLARVRGIEVPTVALEMRFSLTGEG